MSAHGFRMLDSVDAVRKAMAAGELVEINARINLAAERPDTVDMAPGESGWQCASFCAVEECWEGCAYRARPADWIPPAAPVLESSLPACLDEHCAEVELVGSRITCVPPPVGTDQDVLCFVREDRWPQLLSELEQSGWKFDGQEHYANALDDGIGFRSYRHGELNLVLTTDSEFFRRFMAAHSVAKHLNLLVKADRIALFQAVLYGNAMTSLEVGSLEDLLS